MSTVKNQGGRPKQFEDCLRVNFASPQKEFIRREAERRLVSYNQVVREAVQALMDNNTGRKSAA